MPGFIFIEELFFATSFFLSVAVECNTLLKKVFRDEQEYYLLLITVLTIKLFKRSVFKQLHTCTATIVWLKEIAESF